MSTPGVHQPKLSVCIITRDRCQYLGKTMSGLGFLAQLPFSWEIIVSDNASGDATAEVVAQARQRLGHVRYFRQTRNVGPENNLISAFRMAEGELVVYLADDDMLIPEALVSAVTFMEKNQDAVACYCPWELYDDFEKKSLGLFYRVEHVEHFEREDALLLFDFILSGHVFPEIGIYRSAPLGRILYPPRKAYWAYVNLARLLDYGGVAFLPDAFYRSVTRYWEGEKREQHGHNVAVGDWDLVRGGLEFLLQKALELSGRGALSEEQRLAYLAGINRFMTSRMKVALRLFVEKGDFLSAYYVYKRLLLWNSLSGGDVAWCRSVLASRAPLQSLAETLDAATRLREICLYGVPDPVEVVKLLRDLRPGVEVKVLTDADISGLADKDGALVLAGSETDRSKVMQAGFKAGMVVAVPDLAKVFGC